MMATITAKIGGIEMNKLSRKDITMLKVLATTGESKDKLSEYVEQHQKAVKAYKAFRESVVAEVEVDKVIKSVETKRKFKAGDKVRVTSVASDVANTTGLSVGDVAEVIAYKNDSLESWQFIGIRPVIVTGGRSRYAFFGESALELVTEENNKRKFKKGDKVRIVKAKLPDARTSMKVGEATKVLGYKGVDINWSYDKRRPVVAEDKLGRRAFFEEHALELVEEKTQNQLRAEIIEKAKKCVEEWLKHNTSLAKWNARGAIACDGYAVLPYITVDKEKRVVHFVGRGASLPTSKEVKVRTKAVCHPNDVFNEHIGKAIALGRALGKDVTEFENAVQPDEIVVGHSISSTRKDGSYYEYPSVTKVEEGKVWGVDSVRNSPSFTRIKDSYEDLATRPKITDDTNAQYGGVE